MRVFLVCLALFCVSCHSAHQWPLVVVLGIDGMDPEFVGKHLSELPHLQALMKTGEFKRLRTTMPPQSPVAWSTFSTGLDPVQHGIFDFVYRDPQTMTLFSSMGDLENARHKLQIGPYVLPLGSPSVKTFRKGIVFWKLLDNAGVPVTVLRMPVNYPPEQTKGNSLSGMGVPDMAGTFGTYTFFNNPPLKEDRAVLTVAGPPNPYRKDKTPSTVQVTVDVDPFEEVARFRVQDNLFILRAGEWSGWIPVTFLESTHGMIRLYAKSFRPDFQVYVSPVNINPLHPAVAISSPASYSAQLAAEIGLFYTQGIPEDTSAYRQNVFTREEYLMQSGLVANEQIQMLKAGLTGMQGGLFFWHFSPLDQNSHMLFGKYDETLLRTYRQVDDVIGWVMVNKPEARIIVMSDHGFAPFLRAVNLNAWLKQQGLETSAYALGLNALYLKLAGRERGGTVAKERAPETLASIETALLALRDPVNGNKVVTRVWSPHPDFQGDIQFIPDLIVGFARGYRASWNGSLGNGSLGQSDEPVIFDNTDAWVGDHCMDPDAVPGLLISNRKSTAERPELKDVTTSILHLFAVQPADDMHGKVIY
jgi:predicted AlkP superfamily phosphohydrolase/phosphomutase